MNGIQLIKTTIVLVVCILAGWLIGWRISQASNEWSQPKTIFKVLRYRAVYRRDTHISLQEPLQLDRLNEKILPRIVEDFLNSRPQLRLQVQPRYIVVWERDVGEPYDFFSIYRFSDYPYDSKETKEMDEEIFRTVETYVNGDLSP